MGSSEAWERGYAHLAGIKKGHVLHHILHVQDLQYGVTARHRSTTTNVGLAHTCPIKGAKVELTVQMWEGVQR